MYLKPRPWSQCLATEAFAKIDTNRPGSPPRIGGQGLRILTFCPGDYGFHTASGRRRLIRAFVAQAARELKRQGKHADQQGGQAGFPQCCPGRQLRRDGSKATRPLPRIGSSSLRCHRSEGNASPPLGGAGGLYAQLDLKSFILGLDMNALKYQEPRLFFI